MDHGPGKQRDFSFSNFRVTFNFVHSNLMFFYLLKDIKQKVENKLMDQGIAVVLILRLVSFSAHSSCRVLTCGVNRTH